MAELIKVGNIKALYRYPVKSMAGESVEEIRVGWHGFEADRRYSFVQSENKAGFPWLTARQFHKLILYKPRFEDSENAKMSEIIVTTPDGKELPLKSDEILEEIQKDSGYKIHWMQLYSGIFDSMDLSVISTNTIDAISEKVGIKMDPRRFRPNILIEPDDKKASEQKWIGKTLVFGEHGDLARIRLNREDPRCLIVSLDPDTAERNEEIQKEIALNFKNEAGVYASCNWPGKIHVGQNIYIKKD